MNKITIIKSDTERIKKLIERDFLDSMELKMTIKKWLKQVERIISENNYQIFEPFKDYFINYSHFIALQGNPIGYNKIYKNN